MDLAVCRGGAGKKVGGQWAALAAGDQRQLNACSGGGARCPPTRPGYFRHERSLKTKKARNNARITVNYGSSPCALQS